jgi:NAD+ kinase
MRAVGFVVHPARRAAVGAAETLAAWLEDRGIGTSRLDETRVEQGERVGGFDQAVDLVVAVGGDGTFLRAAHVASRADVPVLGIKVGRVGFLTEIEPEGATSVLERMLDGSARIEDRLAVLAQVEGAGTEPQWALNEVIVEKSVRHRLIRLAVIVDETYVTTFSADGVIVATPTGSTAYSFSAGGPIVSPWVPCLIVTPVAAHMVFDRSLVLAHDQRVALEVVGEEPGLLSADGRASQELPVGARVRIERAPTPSRFVRPDDAPAFHALVREKFDLPGQDGGRRGGV